MAENHESLHFVSFDLNILRFATIFLNAVRSLSRQGRKGHNHDHDHVSKKRQRRGKPHRWTNKNLSRGLKPTTTKRCKKYRDVALEHIKCTISLEMLTAVQHDCDATVDLPFPSWVPQWNKCNGTQPLGFVTGKHFASANRDAIITPSADTDPDTLIARGTIVSMVVYTSSLCQSSSFDWALRPNDDLTASANSVTDTWLKLKLYLAQARGEKYPRTVLFMASDDLAVFGPECDILTAYMRTWVAGKNLSEVDGFDLENDVNAYWHCLWASPTEGTRNYSEDHLRRAERYRASAAAIADQRNLFILRKGLVGLGPGAMRKGDWVAVLLGADVPFVIREIGGEHRAAGDPFPDDVKFQLVGECYVHGVMTGGAVKGVEVTRDIVLV